jgi:hypothetical protein
MAAAYVGTFTAAEAGSAVASITTGSRTSTASTLIVAIAASWNDTSSTVNATLSDNQSNSFTESVTHHAGIPGSHEDLTLSYNPPSGTRGAGHTVTTSYSPSAFGSVGAFEFSGIATAPTVATGTANSAGGGSTDTDTTAAVSVTPGAGTHLAIAAVSPFQSPQPTVSLGTWTDGVATSGGYWDGNFDGSTVFCAHKVSCPASTAQTANFNYTSGCRWLGVMATFAEAVAADTQEWRGSYPFAKLRSTPSLMYSPCR